MSFSEIFENSARSVKTNIPKLFPLPKAHSQRVRTDFWIYYAEKVPRYASYRGGPCVFDISNAMRKKTAKEAAYKVHSNTPAFITANTPVSDAVLKLIAYLPTRSLLEVVEREFFKTLTNRDFMRIAVFLAQKKL